MHTCTHAHTHTHVQVTYIMQSEGFGLALHPVLSGNFGILVENWDSENFTALPFECKNTQNQKLTDTLAWISTDQYSTLQHVSMALCMYVGMALCVYVKILRTEGFYGPVLSALQHVGMALCMYVNLCGYM